jgi:hypothetical protein
MVRVVDGQHVVVPPEGGVAEGEVSRPHVLGRALEVVAGEQRGLTVLAKVEHAVRLIPPTAAGALEVRGGHAELYARRHAVLLRRLRRP